MDRLKDIVAFVMAAMAVFTLIGAAYQAFNNSIKSATALGALCALAVVLLYLPQLEVFKAFGIEARLRSTLDRAEEIVARLKQLAVINAKVTYLTMAWENRMGSPTAKDKQAVLDEVDQQLVALKVSDEERRDIKKPLVQMIGLDLNNIYSQVMERFLYWKRKDLTQLANREQSEEARAALQQFTTDEGEWRAAASGQSPFKELANYDLKKYLIINTPTALLDEPQKAIAERFRAEILGLYNACQAKGGFTPAAAEFYDTYQSTAGADRKLMELFGISVSE
jgi:hypothetical protein